MSEDVEGLKKRASESRIRRSGLWRNVSLSMQNSALLEGKLAELTERRGDTLERLGAAESEVDASIAGLTSLTTWGRCGRPASVVDRLRSPPVAPRRGRRRPPCRWALRRLPFEPPGDGALLVSATKALVHSKPASNAALYPCHRRPLRPWVTEPAGH